VNRVNRVNRGLIELSPICQETSQSPDAISSIAMGYIIDGFKVPTPLLISIHPYAPLSALFTPIHPIHPIHPRPYPPYSPLSALSALFTPIRPIRPIHPLSALSNLLTTSSNLFNMVNTIIPLPALMTIINFSLPINNRPLMVSADNADLSHPKHLTTYIKLVGIQTGLLVQALNYHDVKRMVDIDDETVEAGEDPLSEMLIEALEEMETDDDAEIKPIGSIAALFDRGDVPRELKPRLYACFSLRDGVSMIGALVTCLFTRDETLGTSILSQSWCASHNLPRFDGRWSFIDVIVSQQRPAGALLVMHAILAASRARKAGVCAVAVTSAGHRLLRSLNFTCVPYRERSSQRHMCYLRLPQDLSFTHMKRKLHFDGDNQIVGSICWRDSLSASAKSSIVGRC
jgi:hypothetical protein